MVKLAMLDWDDTLVHWNDALRKQVITDILCNYPDIISQVMQDRVHNDFSALVEEARRYAQNNGLNPKSATVLFDYLFIHVGEPKRSDMVKQAQRTYREEAAKRLTFYPGVLEELHRLKAQGYTLVVISNKSEDNMQIEYQAVVKNYPQLAALIPQNQVFATNVQAHEKPNDFLHRQALTYLHNAGIIQLHDAHLELLIIGDSLPRDGEAAKKCHNTLFHANSDFAPLPNPYMSNVLFALFDPKKQYKAEALASFQLQGIEAFSADSWELLSKILIGAQKSKKDHKSPHSEQEVNALAEQYLKGHRAGYYMLRTKPRSWAQITESQQIIVGKAAQPLNNGNLKITVVDVEEHLDANRSRYYEQDLFVYEGSVFNAAAYVYFKDPKGQEHILFIRDKRDWNVPIGRVDGDELAKANPTLLNKIRGFGPDKVHCILAALRELEEEAGFDISPFIAKRETRIIPYSSNNLSGNVLSYENNYATTATMHVVVDLGTLSLHDIQNIQKQLRPQAKEHIDQAQIIPVAHIHEENHKYYWQLPGTEQQHPIFSHVGRVLANLKAQRWMPFDTATPSAKKQDEPAPWYVMVTNQQIPAEATIYNPSHYISEERSTEQMQKDLVLCQQMTGIEVFNFSPLRLALHETILALSVYNTWTSEDQFFKSVSSIYEEQVKPLIAHHQKQFNAIAEQHTQEVATSVKSEILDHKSQNLTVQLVLAARESFDRALHSHHLRYDKLDTKIKEYNASTPGVTRPTITEREEHQRLAQLIAAAKKNKSFIIQQAVTAQIVHKTTTQCIRGLLFEQQAEAGIPLLRRDELAQQYQLKPKTFHSNEQRKSLLIVGGPASGKGRVTEQQISLFNHDMLELNPDLYKRLLLPMSDVPDEIKKHGTLTHNESSLIFDNLIEYWAKLATSGSAPHTLIDVARAGAWVRGKLSIGTQIEVHSPLLPVIEALNRSYQRGVKTGRFAPTAMLLQAHKDQVSINLDAMRSGCEFTFYDTNVGFDDRLPVTAKYLAHAKKLEIYSVSTMLEYFQKADLTTSAFNESTLWGHMPKSTVHHILNYANHMSLHFLDTQEQLAHLQKNSNGLYTLYITNWDLLKKQLHVQNNYFIQGFIENGVYIEHTSADLGVLISSITDRLKQVKPEMPQILNSDKVQFDEQQCIDTACKMVEQGVDYVRGNHGLWVYTPPEEEEAFKALFPEGIQILKTTELGEEKVSIYKQGQQLTFDIREFSTSDSCDKVIQSLKKHGKVRSQHIALNKYVASSYYCAEPKNANTIQLYTALPKRVRAFFVNNPKQVQIINSHGFPVRPKLNGWVKCAEEHLDALITAVKHYREQPDEQNKNALLHLAMGHLYCSGPFNIEDGYDYYVSQTELKEVLEQLIREPSLYKDKYTNELHTSICLNKPLNFRKDERIEAGNYLILAEKERASLTRLMAQIDSEGIALDKIPGLHVVQEDDVRRTYTLAYMGNSSIQLLQEPANDSSSASGVTQKLELRKLLKKDLFNYYSSLRNRFKEAKNPLLTSMPELRDEVEAMLEALYHPFIENLITHQKKTDALGSQLSPLECARNTCITELRSVLLRQVVDSHPDMASYPYTPIAGDRLSYVPTVTAISKALDFFDVVERTTKTNVPNLYHADRYTHYEQQLPLDLDSGFTLPFSGILTLTDLIRLRSVPLWVTGVSVKTVFADAFFNSPKDFYVHDVNHNRRFRGYNDMYFKKHGIVTEEGRYAAYLDFYNTIEQLIIPSFKIVPTDSAEQKLLKLTIKTFYFEFLHEYSFPPDRDFLIYALRYRSGDPGPFEVYVPAADSSKASIREDIAATRMPNNNLQSGFSSHERHDPNRLLDVFLYHDNQSPNIITALFNKLSNEFYDSVFFRIKDIPSKKHRGPDLVVKAVKVVMATFKIGPEDIGLTAEMLDQSLLELATNKKMDGDQLGHVDKYIHKLQEPALRSEVVKQAVLSEGKQGHHKFFRANEVNDDLATLKSKGEANDNSPRPPK